MFAALLVLLTASTGFLVSVVHPERLGFPEGRVGGIWDLWLGTLRAFGVPLLLVLIARASRFWAAMGYLLWSVWVVGLTLLAAGMVLPNAVPSVRWEARMVLGTLLVLALAVLVTSTQTLLQGKRRPASPEDSSKVPPSNATGHPPF